MKRCLCMGAVLAGLAAAGVRAQDGLFADFSTSMGEFTVQLDYENAPRAAANFVGLATGERGWADPDGNVWHTPYFDGSIFHRVVQSVDTNPPGSTNGICVQGGGLPSVSTDTNGVTTTGFVNAGYAFLEDLTNGLSHTSGAISMANAGPNTEGAQFFIMATNYPVWDGSYSVFGYVVTGQDVVAAMSLAALEPGGSRPVTDIVLSNVTIRRVGAAAEAFSITNQGLPIVEDGPLGAHASGDDLMLDLELGQDTETLFRESDGLESWETSYDFGYYDGSTITVTNSVPRAVLGDTYFFHSSRIRYPVPRTTPASVRGRTFSFWWDVEPPVHYVATFSTNAMTQGTYTVTQGTNDPVSGAIFIYESWTRDVYSARLFFTDSTGKSYSYSLGFDPGGATNRFTGSWGPGFNTPYPMTGVFTNSPAP